MPAVLDLRRCPAELPPRWLDLHQQTNTQINATKVCSSIGLIEHRKEDVVDYGYRPLADPAVDLRPNGSKSKLWALDDSDDSDEEVAFQSPLMLDLVRHVAVHGFTKDKLFDTELALQDSSVCRRVE